MVIPYQISNLNRLPSPSLILLIRRHEVEIYRTIKSHRGEPFEFFVRIPVALSSAIVIDARVAVSIGIIVILALG